MHALIFSCSVALWFSTMVEGSFWRENNGVNIDVTIYLLHKPAATMIMLPLIDSKSTPVEDEASEG